ncbi:hypothetical protein THAOC_26248 [Thalassiosira oceanica]|uniref:Uncharacterized protein n=1 Tax=Thalassiosira oceanica TaxID=159749 RepID=K0RM72_THAOC|nr:hypothetical protein THAOC_26248 [Thalassiosira oceanica]|eukprot:EJK54185.1 hypothetical protein THAOC_26248 [Thalassiosira oceanica]
MTTPPQASDSASRPTSSPTSAPRARPSSARGPREGGRARPVRGAAPKGGASGAPQTALASSDHDGSARDGSSDAPSYPSSRPSHNDAYLGDTTCETDATCETGENDGGSYVGDVLMDSADVSAILGTAPTRDEFDEESLLQAAGGGVLPERYGIRISDAEGTRETYGGGGTLETADFGLATDGANGGHGTAARGQPEPDRGRVGHARRLRQLPNVRRVLGFLLVRLPRGRAVPRRRHTPRVARRHVPLDQGGRRPGRERRLRGPRAGDRGRRRERDPERRPGRAEEARDPNAAEGGWSPVVPGEGRGSWPASTWRGGPDRLAGRGLGGDGRGRRRGERMDGVRNRGADSPPDDGGSDGRAHGRARGDGEPRRDHGQSHRRRHVDAVGVSHRHPPPTATSSPSDPATESPSPTAVSSSTPSNVPTAAPTTTSSPSWELGPDALDDAP